MRSLSVGSLQPSRPPRPFSRFAHLSPAIRRTWHASTTSSATSSVPVAQQPPDVFTKSDELLMSASSKDDMLASQSHDEVSAVGTDTIPMDEIL